MDFSCSSGGLDLCAAISRICFLWLRIYCFGFPDNLFSNRICIPSATISNFCTTPELIGQSGARQSMALVKNKRILSDCGRLQCSNIWTSEHYDRIVCSEVFQTALVTGSIDRRRHRFSISPISGNNRKTKQRLKKTFKSWNKGIWRLENGDPCFESVDIWPQFSTWPKKSGLRIPWWNGVALFDRSFYFFSSLARTSLNVLISGSSGSGSPEDGAGL